MATPRKSAEAKPDLARVREAEREVGDHLDEDQRQERIRNRDGVAPDPTNPDFWAHLARAFPVEEQEKLPRNVKRQDEDKGPCEDTPRGRKYSADGYYCGGWHARSIHLDYIGHAGITMRLNEDVGPQNWDLQPLAVDPQGVPVVGRQLWAKLTILGVEKIDLAENFAHHQEAWGDALRRTASRFGIGTYLWSKSERALAMKANTEEAQVVPEQQKKEAEQAGPPEHVVKLKERLGTLSEGEAHVIRTEWGTAKLPRLEQLTPQEAAVVNGWLDAAEEAKAQAVLAERLGAQEEKQEQAT